MAKRKTIKPVKAWAIHIQGMGLMQVAFRRRADALAGGYMKNWGSKVVRFTVSVDDPAATRISAAQRRVVEAVEPVLAAFAEGVSWTRAQRRTYTKLAKTSGELSNLERAKGDHR
jgi:hypothetical protein